MSVRPQLTQLEHAGLVRVGAVEPELLYLFRHGLIQDAELAERAGDGAVLP